MNVLQIKCFWSVVTTGSFTEAGEMLHLSQSTVTKKIHALEQELGVQLLNRSGRKFSLSSEGRKMMPHFAEIIECYDQAMLTLDDIKNSGPNHKQVLRIIAVPPVINYGVLPKINFFAREHPNIEFHFDEMDEDRLLLVLQSGESDLVFCSDIEMDTERYGTQKYCEEVLMAAMSRENPLAGREAISFSDLKGSRLILNRRESKLYDLSIDSCRRAGVEPNAVMTTNRPNIAIEQLTYNSDMVYIGLRATLAPKTSNIIRILPITDTPVFDFVFAWKLDQHLSPYAKKFLDYLK